MITLRLGAVTEVLPQCASGCTRAIHFFVCCGQTGEETKQEELIRPVEVWAVFQFGSMNGVLNPREGNS